MFTKIVFSNDRIVLNAYTVASDGVCSLYDTYTFNKNMLSGVTVSGSVSPLVSDYAENNEFADLHNHFGKAKVELYNAANGKLEKTVYAEAKNGKSASFSIDEVVNGSYNLVVSRGAMGTIVKALVVSGNSVDMGVLALTPSGNSGAERATISDVVECINIYLSNDGRYPGGSYKFYADTNGDGVIGLIDCVKMMNAYLKK